MEIACAPEGDSAERLAAQRYLVSFSVDATAPDYLDQISAAFASEPLAHLIVFASQDAAFSSLVSGLHSRFECPVIGCTSAGEISDEGYVEGEIVLVGLPKRWFAARTVLIENLKDADFPSLNDHLIQKRLALSAANPSKNNGFSFLLVDGLSRREDQLVSGISPSLAGFPLFGGSAGDGRRFVQSLVAYEGQVHENAATLTFILTECRVNVFSLNHMVPCQTRMVVTKAEPNSRIVCGINDEPAAAEFARLIGKDPQQLDEFTFAENPVTVRVGNQYHVRAIQRVNEDGHLVFFSAIDEGMVLTVADRLDMAEHLEGEFAKMMKGKGRPDILACDCFLRRVEAERSQASHKVNAVFKKHGIVGFSTYGEQIGPLHVNHTLTGVALFPPAAGD